MSTRASLPSIPASTQPRPAGRAPPCTRDREPARPIPWWVAWSTCCTSVTPIRVPSLSLPIRTEPPRELRTRCRAALGEQASLLTIGTIHAFAHEILRRYSPQAGLPPDFPVFDLPAMLVLLRARLADFCAMLGDLEPLVPLDAPLPFLSRLCEVVGRAREDCIDAATFAERLAALPSYGNRHAAGHLLPLV